MSRVAAHKLYPEASGTVLPLWWHSSPTVVAQFSHCSRTVLPPQRENCAI
ncbi:MAG: hypothetical protein IJT97_09705 [Bacteroidaceae bacterium]|nr:hypothetical protein [Bacteroidaceae bacterium]